MTNWWDAETPEVKEIARRMCKSFAVSPDEMCIGFEPFVIQTASGVACPIPSTSLRPFWSFNIAVAKLAVECRDAIELEKVVQTTEPEADTFTDKPDPNKVWRAERGLDGEPD
jgi:hypothetical protein